MDINSFVLSRVDYCNGILADAPNGPIEIVIIFLLVLHRRLLQQKIENHGIVPDRLLKWISKFLSGWTMRVKVRSNFSSWEEVWSGVPDGSVLGMLLFLTLITKHPDRDVKNMLM